MCRFLVGVVQLFGIEPWASERTSSGPIHRASGRVISALRFEIFTRFFWRILAHRFGFVWLSPAPRRCARLGDPSSGKAALSRASAIQYLGDSLPNKPPNRAPRRFGQRVAGWAGGGGGGRASAIRRPALHTQSGSVARPRFVEWRSRSTRAAAAPTALSAAAEATTEAAVASQSNPEPQQSAGATKPAAAAPGGDSHRRSSSRRTQSSSFDQDDTRPAARCATGAALAGATLAPAAASMHRSLPPSPKASTSRRSIASRAQAARRPAALPDAAGTMSIQSCMCSTCARHGLDMDYGVTVVKSSV